MGSTLLAEVQYKANGAFTRTLMFLHDEKGAIVGVGVKNAGDARFTNYYYAKNLQGDVVAIYRSDYNSTSQTYYPTLVASYEYDPWGKVTSVKGSSGAILSLEAYPNHIAHVNPIRYRGYYYDNETGFYYLQSRYYDPIISRFINADSYGSTGQGFLGTNMFAYCNNNPVNYADPEGNLLERVLGGLIGAGLGALTTWATGGSTKEIIEAALIGGVTGAIPEIGTFVNVCTAVKTTWDCWTNGTSFLSGVACGVFSYGAGCIGGKTGDQLTDKLVEYVFGTPANLFSNITSNTVQQNAQRAREEKRNSSPQPNLADWGERPFISPDPEKPVCGGGGRRVRCYW